MRNFGAAIFAMFCFYGVVASGGGFAKGIFVGLLMGGMWWLAFCWKPETKKQSKIIVAGFPKNNDYKKEELIYRDDNKGMQHRLSAEQYGEMCVIWGVNAEKMATMKLGLFGSVRKNPDIIAKIHKSPRTIKAYGTIFFVAVYCCYPVIRLGISNEFFKGVMQGVRNTILQGGSLFNGHPSNTTYYQNLASAANEYIATFIEMAGMEYEDNYDQMLLGVSGACAKLFIDLEREYAGLQLDEFVPYISDGTFENPAIMESQNKDQELLIRYAFSSDATQFIKATDESRNLIFVK